jgi:hypothetical protein
MSNRCPSCEILYINNVRTHEAGCPDAWRDQIKKCKWCGENFKPESPHQDCCCHSCHVAFQGLDCDCIECNPEPEGD